MTVLAHAKVNFTLEVFGRRADGYHALRSVVMPISLCDLIEIEPTDDGSLVSDTGYSDDLCIRAAGVLRNACRDQGAQAGGRATAGARICVTKRIPAGGGLGGGSADAAAVLRALNDLWHLGRTPEELAEIGAQVGSDVPALVLAQHDGCPVLMEGRGEKVMRLPVPGFQPPTLNLLLVHPAVFSSTREVYAACSPRGREEASPTDGMIAALSAGDFGRVASSLSNDLQGPAVRLHSEIGAALAELKTAGAEGVLMTGSGSCVFGLASSAAAVERMAVDLRSRGFSAIPLVTACRR